MVLDGLSDGRIFGGDGWFSKIEMEMEKDCKMSCLHSMFCDFAGLASLDDGKKYCLLYDYQNVDLSQYNSESLLWYKTCLTGTFI